MDMGFFGIFSLLLSVLTGGGSENDLLDFVDTKTYWELKQIAPSEERLLMEFAPPGEPVDVSRLIADMGADDFTKREAATRALEGVGDGARPQLEEAVKSDNLEVSKRARKLLDGMESKKRGEGIRRLMAIRTLGEMKAAKAKPVLGRLLASTSPFEADYASAALAAIKDKPYSRPHPGPGVRRRDLACLPGPCTLVAQLAILGKDRPKAKEALSPLRNVMKMIEQMDGGGADDTFKELQEGLVKAADMVGNVRAHSVTVGVGMEEDGEPSFAAIFLRGQYNAKALRRLMEDEDAERRVRNSIPFYYPDDEFGVVPLSNERLVLLAGDNYLEKHEGVVEEMLAALKGDPVELRLKEPMRTVVENANTGAGLWAAMLIHKEWKEVPGFNAFDSVSLFAQPAKDNPEHLLLKVLGTGSDPALVSAAGTLLTGALTGFLPKIEKEVKQHPGGKGVVDFLRSIKVKSEDKSLEIRARLDAGTGGPLFSLPLFLFGMAFQAEADIQVELDPDD